MMSTDTFRPIHAREQTMSTLVLYGLSRNLMSGRRDAEGNHRHNQYIDSFRRFIYETDPCILTYKILLDTRVGVDREYCCFCYINYAAKDGALKGKTLFDSAILKLLMRPTPSLDASYMFTSLKTKCEYWAPVFSIWVGNILQSGSAALEKVFKSFGPLATLRSHGALPYKILTDGEQPSAIVNYIHCADAMTFLDACNAGSIHFHPIIPVVARPRANVVFVRNLLNTGMRVMSLRYVRFIAKSMRDDEPEFIEHLVAILRACPGFFRVELETSTIFLLAAANEWR